MVAIKGFYPDEAYEAVARYRASLDSIVEKAVRHFEGCVVEWRHARIYAIELDNVPAPKVGYDPTADLEAAKQVLRNLVNQPS